MPEEFDQLTVTALWGGDGASDTFEQLLETWSCSKTPSQLTPEGDWREVFNDSGDFFGAWSCANLSLFLEREQAGSLVVNCHVRNTTRQTAEDHARQLLEILNARAVFVRLAGWTPSTEEEFWLGFDGEGVLFRAPEQEALR